MSLQGLINMKTKVRILGDPFLAEKVAQVIQEHFECKTKKFETTPYRYVASMPKAITYYIDIQKRKIIVE